MEKSTLNTLFSSIAIITLLAAVIGKAESNTPKKVSVSVDVKSIVASQNSMYYGGNNIYPKRGQGILLENGEFDPIEMKQVEQLGLRTYRFPGGSEGNLYKWKRAIGPIEGRVDNISGNNRGPQSNEFGPDEFGRLLETTPFDIGVMMVAWGYETPADAADWVEYMNSPVGLNPNGGKDWAAVRAANGHPEPYGIKYWEIGNEVYGNWELNWGSYPEKFDAARGTGNVAQDDTLGKAGTLPFGNADRYVFGGYKYFQSQKAAVTSSWKDEHIKTTLQPNQHFYTKFSPVDLSVADHPFVLKINDETWTRVDSFTLSSPTDKHFTLNTTSGEIVFGDGVNGAIPPPEQFVILDYRTGKQPGFIDYYNAMKEVDPTIDVISCFEKESFYSHMARVGAPFDGVVKHYYPGYWRNAKKEDQYTAAAAVGVNIAKSIIEHKEWMKAFSNASLTGNEQLWITEYGIPNHLVQTLIMQTVINQYSKDVATLLGHSLFLDNNTPMIDDNGVVRAKAIPIPMFSKHSYRNFVQVNVESGSRKYRNITIPDVVVTASTNDSKTKATIILTNTFDTIDQLIDLTIPDLNVSKDASAEVWMLSSTKENPLPENWKNQPTNVVLEKVADNLAALNQYTIDVPAGTIVMLKIH